MANSLENEDLGSEIIQLREESSELTKAIKSLQGAIEAQQGDMYDLSNRLEALTKKMR